MDFRFRFVQIVHVSTGHWACLSNKFSSSGTLELFDSLHTVPEEGDTIIPQACSILRTPEPSLTINVVNVGRQEGGSDCGLYAIAMAYDLCAGVDPVSKNYVQNELRSHLHSCINAKQLKPFSSTDRDITERTISSVNVEVHCNCRMPEGGKWMVCCDRCNIWYHEGCVPVPPEVRNDKENKVPWQCPGCETGTHIKHALSMHCNTRCACRYNLYYFRPRVLHLLDNCLCETIPFFISLITFFRQDPFFLSSIFIRTTQGLCYKVSTGR